MAEGVEEGGLWVVGGGGVVVEIGAGEDIGGGVGDEVLVEVGEGRREGVVAEFVPVEGDEGLDGDGFLGTGLESGGGFVEGGDEDSHEELADFVEF